VGLKNIIAPEHEVGGGPMSSSSKVSIEQKKYLKLIRRVLRRKHYVHRKRKRNIDRNRCNKNRLWRRLIEIIIKTILILLSIARRHIFIS